MSACAPVSIEYRSVRCAVLRLSGAGGLGGQEERMWVKVAWKAGGGNILRRKRVVQRTDFGVRRCDVDDKSDGCVVWADDALFEQQCGFRLLRGRRQRAQPWMVHFTVVKCGALGTRVLGAAYVNLAEVFVTAGLTSRAPQTVCVPLAEEGGQAGVPELLVEFTFRPVHHQKASRVSSDSSSSQHMGLFSRLSSRFSHVSSDNPGDEDSDLLRLSRPASPSLLPAGASSLKRKPSLGSQGSETSSALSSFFEVVPTEDEQQQGIPRSEERSVTRDQRAELPAAKVEAMGLDNSGPKIEVSEQSRSSLVSGAATRKTRRGRKAQRAAALSAAAADEEVVGIVDARGQAAGVDAASGKAMVLKEEDGKQNKEGWLLRALSSFVRGAAVVAPPLLPAGNVISRTTSAEKDQHGEEEVVTKQDTENERKESMDEEEVVEARRRAAEAEEQATLERVLAESARLARGLSGSMRNRHNRSASHSSASAASELDHTRPLLNEGEDADGWDEEGEEGMELGVELGEFWYSKQLFSRGEAAVALSTHVDVFYGSMDQRSNSADGAAACASSTMTLSRWILCHGRVPTAPDELDAALLEGCKQWRALCAVPVHASTFPDRHFDLDTVLADQRYQYDRDGREVKLVLSPERSYVGFFRPTGLECALLADLLDGAKSLADIWAEIASECVSATYIVGWNDHWFVLHLDENGHCYLLDTLGQKLFDGCDRAFALRFPPTKSQAEAVDCEGESHRALDKLGSADGCQAFLELFYTAAPLRQVVADLDRANKTHGSWMEAISPETVLRQLQIDFHRVELQVV